MTAAIARLGGVCLVGALVLGACAGQPALTVSQVGSQVSYWQSAETDQTKAVTVSIDLSSIDPKNVGEDEATRHAEAFFTQLAKDLASRGFQIVEVVGAPQLNGGRAGLSDDQLARLLDALSVQADQITTLRLENLLAFSPDNLVRLAGFSHLVDLAIAADKRTDLSALPDLPAVTTLTLFCDDTTTKEQLGLGHLPDVAALTLVGADLPLDGFAAVLPTLAQLASLRVVDPTQAGGGYGWLFGTSPSNFTRTLVTMDQLSQLNGRPIADAGWYQQSIKDNATADLLNRASSFVRNVVRSIAVNSQAAPQIDGKILIYFAPEGGSDPVIDYNPTLDSDAPGFFNDSEGVLPDGLFASSPSDCDTLIIITTTSEVTATYQDDAHGYTDTYWADVIQVGGQVHFTRVEVAAAGPPLIKDQLGDVHGQLSTADVYQFIAGLTT